MFDKLYNTSCLKLMSLNEEFKILHFIFQKFNISFKNIAIFLQFVKNYNSFLCQEKSALKGPFILWNKLSLPTVFKSKIKISEWGYICLHCNFFLDDNTCICQNDENDSKFKRNLIPKKINRIICKCHSCGHFILFGSESWIVFRSICNSQREATVVVLSINAGTWICFAYIS